MGFAKSEIGVGIIGLGMGQAAFVTHPLPGSTMRVRAVCDTNAQRLEKVSQEHPGVFATTDFRDLLKREDIDVVGVYSPDPLHFEHCLAALDAGKHIVCTKPMVTSHADAKALQAAVKRAGKKFLVGQTCRFIPAYIAAKRLAQEQRYGRLLYIEATYNHDMRGVLDHTPWRYQMPQDMLYGGLCHPMDLALWIGGRVAEISAFAACSGLDPRYPKDLPDNYVANLRFESGALGRVIGLYGVPHAEGLPYIELTVGGTHAVSHQEKLTWDANSGAHRTENISAHLPEAHAGTDYSGHSGEVARYLLHFERCLREDLAPDPGIVEGLRVISALSAVRESARTGRSVKVEWE